MPVVFISDFNCVDCRRAKGEDEEDGEMRACSTKIKYGYPMSFYTLVILLGA